jgi:adenosylhomocysteine nucleosidase
MPDFVDRPRIAIVAALDREVGPLIKHLRIHQKMHAGYTFKFYEGEDAVLVCGGIGAAPARRAAEAVIAIYSPSIIYSAGFAGALTPEMKIGKVLNPRRVINAADGSSVDTGTGEGVLVSFASVASPQQKLKLRESYEAHAVDMEAAAVARAAEARGVQFAAVKVISDEFDFALPATERFITPDGQFREWKFAVYVILRPWLWRSVSRLARNSSRASLALCESLSQIISTRAHKGTTSAIPQGAFQR